MEIDRQAKRIRGAFIGHSNFWTPSDIKRLRLRLGWSLADFSRRFGRVGDLILDWEKGIQNPSGQDLIQIQQLAFYLESYSEQLARSPVAENLLSELGVEQIHQEEVQKRNHLL